MSYNLHNRDLLSLVHHSTQDLRFLLDLARDLKRAKYSGTEKKTFVWQKHCPDFRENLHPHPLRV